jgi:hypothetical protein
MMRSLLLRSPRPHLAAIGRMPENARRAADLGGKPTSCWISSTATERGDLRAACTAGWHLTLPMSARLRRLEQLSRPVDQDH